LSFSIFLYHRRAQKPYYYIDETGQVAASDIFVVVAVVSAKEQEPLIRLADMWAGCIRGARQGEHDKQALLERAHGENYLRCTK
jgi:hypothetical protein